MDHHSQPPPRGGRPVTSKDVAHANAFFEEFLNATTLKNILGYYRSICDLLNLKPNLFPLFYPKLRGYLTSWKAKALWKKFDTRASHKCYGKGKLCSGSRVLIIGAGPCGLRSAIEAQLLGAKVVVIEKRDRLSRNNVLHLWPFVIEDLRALGAKKFFGKFCAGAIDHISIRQLQCILLKVVLLLGVEVHTEVSFERLVEPDPLEKTGWRAEFEPSTHPVSQYEFDVIIGADGKRNTLQGFKRKEFRGKLAIAITANFINKRTEAEARVEEISGVAFIFNQKFFKELYEATGIDLENIVYYKDDTHYFVMTAKKPSLIEKGVIKQDLADTERLLAPDNVNREALMDYAREAANFSTNYQMPDVEFAVNHYGQPDVAMFDFTSMYAAENASKVVERSGFRLLMILVGDSLLEPFWPTGSGCARGFLSSLDAAWAIRSWCSGTMNPLDVVAERESIYRLLGQTTPDNLNKDWKAYTLDPVTRYPNLNKNVVMPHQTAGLFDSDNPNSIERMRRHLENVAVEVPKKRRRGNVDNEVLLNWISEQVREHSDIVVTDLASVFRNGKVLCAVINHYRPDLLDYSAIKEDEPAKINQIALDVLEREIGISPIMTGEEITHTEDYLSMTTYLTQVYDNFRCEIPHIKHPKLSPVKIPPPPPTFVPSTPELAPRKAVSKFSTVRQVTEVASDETSCISSSVADCEPVKIDLGESRRVKFEPIKNVLHVVSKNPVGADASDSVSTKKIVKSSSKPSVMRHSGRNGFNTLFFRPCSGQADAVRRNNPVDGLNKISSRRLEKVRSGYGIIFEERTLEIKLGNTKKGKEVPIIKLQAVSSECSRFRKRPMRKGPARHFSVIMETEEFELPDSKKSEPSFKSIKLHHQPPRQPSLVCHPPPRPSSRHKRHAADATVSVKPNHQLDRKTRKRRTMEKTIASIDHENKLPNQTKGNTDEDFAARIKNLEDKWKEPQPVEKKPKDLLRAIGKIETSDWNIKEIEKKIRENKLGKPGSKDKEKVPKWSKETFMARQNKMEKQHLERQDSAEAKFADIDKNIKHLELKLKEGNSRDLGQNKVATITEKLSSKAPEEPKPIQKSNSRPVILPSQNASEFCHFCGKRVYLMERLSAEGRFFHHGCFKCQYCHTQLRLGSYAFDRDGMYGHKFFCIHHYGMQGEIRATKVVRKPSQRQAEKKPLSGIAGVDLLDRVRTPERVEFANLSVANASDHEESLSQMDEDEWTDKNFGASAAELGSSDDESSSLSDSDSDDEDAYEEALEEPATKEGTLRWAERFNRRYSKKRGDSDSVGYSSSDQSSYYENTSDDDDSDTATEGEEEIRARELRRQEVRVEPPVVQTDTGTDTEVVSDETSSDSSSEVRNSATEISTDSEFAHDDPTPTREVPFSGFDDSKVTKTRGRGPPRKIQVTTGYLQRPQPKAPPPKRDIELNLSPLVPSAPSIVRKPAPLRTEGYALNRTQSTGGIAAKVSLELKKKYLLGETPTPGSIQKSGSASTLDTKLKSFHSNITDCQKMLKPATEISAGMQTFCSRLDERTHPVIPPSTPSPPPPQPPPQPIEVFNPEPEGRPRSPVHETSIIVPKIDWSKKTNRSEDDSLSTDSVSDGDAPKTPEFNFDSIPTVRIDEIPPDSLCDEKGEAPKSIRKTLNQPKQLPELETKDVLPEIHDALHVKRKQSIEAESDESAAEPATVALTETELSDWARDGTVSDDLDDDDFELNLEIPDRSSRKPKTIENKATIAELEDIDHICGKEEVKNKTIITEALNSVLSRNLDIEFMDTGTETSSDDGVVDSQNGYILFKDEDDIPEDSLNVNEIVEAKNEAVKNTGYCVIAGDNFGGEVIDLKPADLEKLKNKNTGEHDEDSLLIVDTGTTTEENTCSDSTVKNLTEISVDKALTDNNNFQRKRLEDKLAKLKAEAAKNSSQNQNENVEFDEHCQRLQSKIEFGNVKDSIDIRKSRRKSKDTPQKPDLIREEKPTPPPSPIVRTPDVLYKKEVIEKERDVNQKLVQEMVMNKMKQENKSLERKRRKSRPFELSKSATTDVVSEINMNNNQGGDASNRTSTYSTGSSVYATPDVLLSTLKQSPETESFATPLTRPLSMYASRAEHPIKENPSLPDVRKALFAEEKFKTPVAPPRVKHEEAKRTAEKLKEDARQRARLLSNEELGLSPEDKLAKLKEKLNRSDKEEETPRTKSSGEIAGSVQALEKFCRSDPNLLDTSDPKKAKKKGGNARERRKSITKLITTFFTKKSPGNSKGIFSRISPKTKDVSKSCANLDLRDPDVVTEEPVRRKSFSEVSSHRSVIENNSPPPVPPLPLNYSKDDSSEGEERRSSCDTLDQSGALDSVANNKAGKSTRRVSRQAQLKRHRMAQEIQRKLEETEVKTRELEERGVLVEKALRGEDGGRYSKDESELLQEWFDLMRDRTELRRYERELMVRAQELELEDRHARLQHELRERLDNNERKTEEEVEIEGSIINEMMEIVAKRDSLIALLEEDRLRYSNEDRDFEEQMLAKGLRLTPIRKTPEK